MIRKATLEDTPKLLSFAERMHQESRYKHLNYDEKKMNGWFKNLIVSPGGLVFITEHGMLAGGIGRYYFGNDLYAFQSLLYVEPEYRGTKEGYLLVKEYIKRAKEFGVKDIHMGNTTLVNTEKTESFFERMGFTYIGGNFLMENK